MIREAKAGSSPAFEKLAMRHQGPLFNFLRLRAGSAADAEDALQDTMTSAWRYLGSYNPRWRFSTWLYRIAFRNLARQRTPICVDSSDDLVAPGSPERWLDGQQTAENLWTLARDVLDSESLSALWLRYAEDLSIREIARATGRSQAWVKVRLYRSRKRLQEHVLVRELDADRRAPLCSMNGS